MTAVEHLTTTEKLTAVHQVIDQQYSGGDDTPWVIAYSGGKDSTLLLQTVWERIAKLPSERRNRKIFVMANDTLVESPMVQGHLRESARKIADAAASQDVPIEMKISEPYADQTFWVNVIGRGYIPPTRNFRWCTDRMKIQPTNLLLKSIVEKHGGATLLIGTRMAESSTRRKNMEKHGASVSKTNPHSSIANCQVMTPLAELEDNEVWTVLAQRKPPWDESHRKLIAMYKNAGGGDCPLVLTKADAPSCGSTSPRFGCWTCTVVVKDRSMLGTIAAGDPAGENLLRFAEFREYLIEVREIDENRWPFRRNGVTRMKNGRRVMGPLKIRVRQEVLERLKQLERETEQTLITQNEEILIRDIWRMDQGKDQRAEAIQ